MPGLAGSLHTVGRLRAIGAAVAAAIALVVLIPSSAHASGCTDTWLET
jgi:hypothetical protein